MCQGYSIYNIPYLLPPTLVEIYQSGFHLVVMPQGFSDQYSRETQSSHSALFLTADELETKDSASHMSVPAAILSDLLVPIRELSLVHSDMTKLVTQA